MNASVTIHFQDGSQKVIDLGPKCIEINLPPTSRQSLAINQNRDGGFNLSFTRLFVDGEKWDRIVIEKQP